MNLFDVSGMYASVNASRRIKRNKKRPGTKGDYFKELKVVSTIFAYRFAAKCAYHYTMPHLGRLFSIKEEFIVF